MFSWLFLDLFLVVCLIRDVGCFLLFFADCVFCRDSWDAGFMNSRWVLEMLGPFWDARCDCTLGSSINHGPRPTVSKLWLDFQDFSMQGTHHFWGDTILRHTRNAIVDMHICTYFFIIYAGYVLCVSIIFGNCKLPMVGDGCWTNSPNDLSRRQRSTTVASAACRRHSNLLCIIYGYE